MASLETRIRDDIKTAMKAGRKDELAVLRMLMSDAKNAAIAAEQERSGWDDTFVIGVVRKGIKTREEAADTYRDAGRADLEQRERFQAEVLRRYLPEEMSLAELEVVVDTVITELGASTRKDMGRVMKEVLTRVEGRADGKAVSSIVGGRLS